MTYSIWMIEPSVLTLVESEPLGCLETVWGCRLSIVFGMFPIIRSVLMRRLATVPLESRLETRSGFTPRPSSRTFEACLVVPALF